MTELPNEIWIGIEWILDKVTDGGWSDVRQTRHVHSFYWIREGKGTFVTDKELAVKPGMLFYLKPGLAMSMKSDAKEPLRIAMVLVNITSLNPVVQLADLELPFQMMVEGEPHRQLDSLFRSLCTGWVPGKPGGELLAKGLVYQILYEITQLQYAGPAAETGPDIFRKIKEELELHFAEELRLKELATRHGISISHLRELFHRYLSISPKAYLDQVRNEHAKKRLIYTDQPVKDIGASCGYADEYHFSKRFKQANGLPPLQYRKRYRR